MPPELPGFFEDPHVRTLLAIIVGFLCACLALMVGQSRHARRQRWEGGRPTAKPDSGPNTDPFWAGSLGEKRTAFRRGGQVVPVYVAEGLGEAGAFEGWVIDRSVG